MRIRAIEIRDRATFIPAVAIDTGAANEGQRYLLARAGYAADGRTILLVQLHTARAEHDPFAWGDRTMHAAHAWIHDHFDELADGRVVDVEYILGEKAAPSRSEAEAIDNLPDWVPETQQ